MPTRFCRPLTLIAILAATSCSAAPLEHYIRCDPPDASIYINGKREGKGDNLLHRFDFTSAKRVWISAVHPDMRAETKAFTPSQIRKFIDDEKNIPFTLGR